MPPTREEKRWLRSDPMTDVITMPPPTSAYVNSHATQVVNIGLRDITRPTLYYMNLGVLLGHGWRL